MVAPIADWRLALRALLVPDLAPCARLFAVALAAWSRGGAISGTRSALALPSET